MSPKTPVTTNITPDSWAHFQALISGEYTNFALLSCFVNGAPTSAIVVATEAEDGAVIMTPLFVAVTPDMVLTDHNGEHA
jgi:hypothetical protein